MSMSNTQMKTCPMSSDLAYHSIAGTIKEAMALRRLSLRDLSDATGLPYRTLQNYLLETRPMPARALALIAEALNVSADWLLLGREPLLDKDIIKWVLEDFEDFVRPEIERSGMDAGAEIFLKLYERMYVLHYSMPGLGPMLAQRKRKTPPRDDEGR